MLKCTLNKLAECVRSGDYYIDPREKNLALLSKYGYTIADQEAILLSLTTDNFVKHEEDRNDKSSEWYWFFNVNYDGKPIYVKFKIIIIDGDFAFIKSLHIDDYYLYA